MTSTTRPSLLQRLREPGDQAAWAEFDARYREVVVRYCMRRGLAYADAEDVGQGVLIALVRSLPRFEYRPEKGRFRGYLARIVHRAVSAHLQRRDGDPRLLEGDLLADIENGLASAPDELWEREWEAHHLRTAMRTIRSTHHARSVAAFDLMLAGASTASIAGELGLSEVHVRKIRQRIGERLAALVERQIEDEG